ncbi:MAG: bleomycin resistance protein [Alphaproteobacteria bacterium]|nr:bleomycin resistance protein [Alphaproteobacteria bacterium]MBU1525638.1 bleomycin resistance protein [Alphaproteobacteria bacterium]MBU2117107.1 bleomycin resistance protein [Alphaproteobacteria bacterium]MBU2350206.1 bleomycin resistance protein [Alphaproteobacteria bacterium]MBU2383758.1 bleomycin resistance protein [Alphaproteobacteria bacterium]
MIQLGYFTLDTPDLDKARAFYGGLFGWTFEADSSHATYAHVADSDPPFGLRKGQCKVYTHLYFRVTDIETLTKRAVDLGGKSEVPSESATGLSVSIVDDQGVSFSLWQPGPGL